MMILVYGSVTLEFCFVFVSCLSLFPLGPKKEGMEKEVSVAVMF